MIIDLVVKTNARESKIVEGNPLKVWLRSKPVKGRANAELIEVLAEHFGVTRDRITLVSGTTSKRKRVEIQYSL